MREIVLDTETTGLDPLQGHRLVEIGAVELFNHIPTGKTYHSFINPQRDVPREAEAVHGLGDAFLKDKPVFAKIADEFTKRLAAHAAHLPVGDPVSGQVALGPVINQKQLDRVQGILADSVKAGARIETGGTAKGLFHQPTVLSGVKPGMRAFDEETFGPVANIIRFASDVEAVELANRHEGALAAAVISRDVGRAMRIGDQLNSGMVHINDQTVNDDCNNPFGGPGVAGAGAAVGGPADLDEYTAWQWVTIKDTPPKYPF